MFSGENLEHKSQRAGFAFQPSQNRIKIEHGILMLLYCGITPGNLIVIIKNKY